MFFYYKTKIKVYSVIFDKSLYPQFGQCVGRCKRPLTSLTGPEATRDTAVMRLGIRRCKRDP